MYHSNEQILCIFHGRKSRGKCFHLKKMSPVQLKAKVQLHEWLHRMIKFLVLHLVWSRWPEKILLSFNPPRKVSNLGWTTAGDWGKKGSSGSSVTGNLGEEVSKKGQMSYFTKEKSARNECKCRWCIISPVDQLTRRCHVSSPLLSRWQGSAEGGRLPIKNSVSPSTVFSIPSTCSAVGRWSSEKMQEREREREEMLNLLSAAFAGSWIDLLRLPLVGMALDELQGKSSSPDMPTICFLEKRETEKLLSPLKPNA